MKKCRQTTETTTQNTTPDMTTTIDNNKKQMRLVTWITHNCDSQNPRRLPGEKKTQETTAEVPPVVFLYILVSFLRSRCFLHCLAQRAALEENVFLPRSLTTWQSNMERRVCIHPEDLGGTPHYRATALDHGDKSAGKTLKQINSQRIIHMPKT